MGKIQIINLNKDINWTHSHGSLFIQFHLMIEQA
jgi:ABC-type oligopeptide transport system ATPase subunit